MLLYGLAVWIALTLVVMAMFAYRYTVARGEDDTVHLADSEVSLIGKQSAFADRLNKIDHWRNMLTAADIVIGLVLVSVFTYNALRTSGLI